MSTVVLGFLFFAMCAYVIAGGADFGVGIVELFAKDKARTRAVGEHAIAPIWEANHIWLIIVIVILFIAFPEIHAAIVTRWHVPLLGMLLGIILRGTAFTFRYYDIGDDRSGEALWSRIFQISSVLVPISFGMIAGSLFSLRDANDVWGLYYAHWLSPFPIAVGVFVATLFAWIASSFLRHEVDADEEPLWIRRSRLWATAMMITGGMVSAIAFSDGLLEVSAIPIVALVAATVSISVVSFTRLPMLITRALVSIVAIAVTVGYFGALYPVAVRFPDRDLLWTMMGPDATINALGTTLLAGAVLILPGLAFLYRVFRN